MNDTPRLIAFHQDTPLTNGAYAAHAARLAAECEALGWVHDISARNYGADYLSIVRGKPSFMLEKLDQYSEPLVYVDVDSRLLRRWDYPPSGRIGWAEKPNGKPYGHVHYLPNTDETRAFLRLWLEILEDWAGGDHSAQWLAAKRMGLEWDRLPNIGARIRHTLSVNESTRQALVHLENIGWFEELEKRMNGESEGR